MNTVEFKLKVTGTASPRRLTVQASEIIVWSDERFYTEVQLRTGKTYAVDEFYADVTQKIADATDTMADPTQIRRQ